MYLSLLSMIDFVQNNNLKEITDPIYLEHGRPTPEGLFSHEIFGISQYDRQTIWAYIDLGSIFLHPLAAINFKRYGSVYENIIYGLKNYRFSNGKFIEDEDGETGIDFLYQYYDQIDWRETESISSSERINFLKNNPKEKIFIDKWPVTPPFYRDINDNSNVGIPEINKMYKKILSQVIALKKKGSFSFFGNLTKANIQRTIVDIFNHYVLDKFHGKNGIMRKFVMGRNIDYSSWLVMSSPVIEGERYTDMAVDFDHAGYPLAAICSMGKPFILKSLKDFFDNEFLRTGKYPAMDYDGNIVYLDLIDPQSEFSEEFLEDKLTQFIKGYSTRFEPVKLPKNAQGIKDLYMSISGRFGSSEAVISRVATWTDVIYLAAERSVGNKYIMSSRYPIEDFYGVIYVKPRIMTTTKTVRAIIDGEEYPFYPVVEPGKDSSNSFVNTMSPCNVYLQAMGGDYDGDSIPNRMIFTDEANADAQKFTREKKNFLNLVGQNVRATERDFIQAIYSLAKPPTQVTLEDLN